MPKSTLIDGDRYRTRRGKLVKIPDEWVGKFTTPATIRRRDSKLTNKLARNTKWKRNRIASTGSQYIKYKDDLDFNLPFQEETK